MSARLVCPTCCVSRGPCWPPPCLLYLQFILYILYLLYLYYLLYLRYTMLTQALAGSHLICAVTQWTQVIQYVPGSSILNMENMAKYTVVLVTLVRSNILVFAVKFTWSAYLAIVYMSLPCLSEKYLGWRISWRMYNVSLPRYIGQRYITVWILSPMPGIKPKFSHIFHGREVVWISQPLDGWSTNIQTLGVRKNTFTWY